MIEFNNIDAEGGKYLCRSNWPHLNVLYICIYTFNIYRIK